MSGTYKLRTRREKEKKKCQRAEGAWERGGGGCEKSKEALAGEGGGVATSALKGAENAKVGQTCSAQYRGLR